MDTYPAHNFSAGLRCHPRAVRLAKAANRSVLRCRMVRESGLIATGPLRLGDTILLRIPANYAKSARRS